MNMETQKTKVPVLLVIAIVALVIGALDLTVGGASPFGAIAVGASVGILSSKAFHTLRGQRIESSK